MNSNSATTLDLLPLESDADAKQIMVVFVSVSK